MRRLFAIWIIVLLLLGAAAADEVYTLPIDFSPGMPLDEIYRVGEWEYEDPTIHVKIETGREDECDWWIASVQIAHASQLRTAAADGFDSDMKVEGEVMARRVNAVIALDGDYYSYSGRGFTLRQGVLYKDNLPGSNDVLVIDEDGDFHALLAPPRHSVGTRIDGKDIINAFFFGPALVVDGQIRTNGYAPMMAGTGNQRMAIAQVGPLDYKVICCGSPRRGSTGMTIPQFAEFVAKQGVQVAYNLDGGDSTVLLFCGEKVNDVNNPDTRPLNDIIYFASAYPPVVRDD